MRPYQLFIFLFLFLFLNFSKVSLASSEFLRDTYGEYIVVLRDVPSPYHSESFTRSVHEELEKKVILLGGRVLGSFSKVFYGAHVRLSPSSATLLKRDAWVKFMAKNDVITLSGEPSRVKSWGLDRIDQKSNQLDDAYVVPYAGVGVHAYVLDTGIKDTHEDFEGRVGDGYSAFGDDFPAWEDCNGHGTHVAGTIGGVSSGVARKVTLHPVRVFKCLGGTTLDAILSGMEWVIMNHEKPAVLNISLGGSKNKAWDEAVKSTVSAGVSVVVAAGNSNNDACASSPSHVPEAITVAASTKGDELAPFSNWGSCVDIAAPGFDIVSASRLDDEAYVTYSGTSMASPHVAGAVALILDKAPLLTPAEISTYLLEHSLEGALGNPKGSPNRLLHVSGYFGYPRVVVSRDQLLRLPKDSTTLVGEAEDYDGRILETRWEQTFGPGIDTKNNKRFSWEHELQLNSLVTGDYGFLFIAQDDGGYTLSQETFLSVRNQNTPPVAEAGYTNKISITERMLLDGQRSYDRDGSLALFRWEQIDGPTTADILNPNAISTRVDGTESGEYRFRLTVEDDEGAVSRDNVTIHVNFPPLVEAGENQRLDFGTESTYLNGSTEDLDGVIAVSLWTQRSGPSEATIVNEYDSPRTQVKDLKEGTYVFELIAMDDSEDIVRDTVDVVVKGEGGDQVWPKVSAGPDRTVQLPQSTITLIGTCEAEESLCTSTSWSLVSSQVRNFHPENLESKEIESRLKLRNLQAGVYTFRFTGKDLMGNENSDEMTLTVVAE